MCVCALCLRGGRGSGWEACNLSSVFVVGVCVCAHTRLMITLATFSSFRLKKQAVWGLQADSEMKLKQLPVCGGDF